MAETTEHRPQIETHPAPEDEAPWLDRQVLGIPREQALYGILILLALISHLVMVGARVQSHDESLHTSYSWDLYDGHGYQHNPMTHGPFLYHATALSYWLFGDNDATARIPVAILGTILVALPYLLRKQLGRSGALVASFLLLISPSLLFYSRYIRHYIPVIAGRCLSPGPPGAILAPVRPNTSTGLPGVCPSCLPPKRWPISTSPSLAVFWSSASLSGC